MAVSKKGDAGLPKIGVIGSRGYSDRGLIADDMIRLYELYGNTLTFVSGGCYNSPDVWAEEALLALGLPEDNCTIHTADWSKGRGAGFERNGRIVDDCDHLLVYWNMDSTGTFDTVKKAKKARRTMDLRIRY